MRDTRASNATAQCSDGGSRAKAANRSASHAGATRLPEERSEHGGNSFALGGEPRAVFYFARSRSRIAPPVSPEVGRRRARRRASRGPEPPPALPRLGKLAGAGVVLGPVGRRQPDRRLPELGAVPEQVPAAHEVPGAVTALVRVAVLDGLDHPAVVDLHLASAIDDAAGVVGVVEVDDVVADEQDRHTDLAQRT